MGQFLGNKYIHSKFEAERYILEAVALHGLSAKIMRVGNLSARSTDGEFQVNFGTNSFMGRIKVYNMLGCCPHTMRTMPLEFSPINEVSKAIILLATTPKECTVFHPYNIHRQYLSDILNGFAAAGIALQRVEKEEFQEALERMMENPDLVTLLRPLMAYNLSSTHQMRWIEADNDYTTQVLYRFGFQWSITARDYVHRFVDTIIGFDYFKQ
jgi:thioester reductase-like protein